MTMQLSLKIRPAKLGVSIILLMSLASFKVCYGQEQPITCWVLMNPVTIDGKWTNANEWADASESHMSPQFGSGTAYVRTKHDSEHFYVLVDFISDTLLGPGDYCTIRLDTKGDGGDAPKEDDYSFVLEWWTTSSSDFWMRRGTGMAWGVLQSPITGATASSDCKPSDDPYLTAAHMVYEFNIPLTIFSSSMSGAICVEVQDRYPTGITMLWPPTYSTDKPSSWGKLTVSTVPIPEFGATWLTAAISVSCAMSLLALNKRRLRREGFPKHLAA